MDDDPALTRFRKVVEEAEMLFRGVAVQLEHARDQVSKLARDMGIEVPDPPERRDR